jgi:beta-galactosidase/beta-glucuronidase
MTDTEAKINGKSAGDKHQGSFYRFRYNITDKLSFGKTNLLEVTVSKMSSNKSVNHAERYADYWIFGGIFRPVYLEAFPGEYIERTAITARADGFFAIDVFARGLSSDREIRVDIFDKMDKKIASFFGKAERTDSLITLNHTVKNPDLWSSERPTLYKAAIYLQDGKKILYETSEKFGFRTVEIKHGDGIYINDKKIKMKGINRHVFWPETGRTVNRKIDLMDAALIKEMNMNSVRCSHYPPDKSFLEICDSLGLYVLDELAGWQNAYDTGVGEKLVKEMVLRDVNHPSIIFWSNGNEGGTNKELDDDFLKYDPSGRPVIHAHHRPGNEFNGIDTNHYESYESTQRILEDSLIYMTTEFLHAQNDGGGGAGLKDYWELMWSSPKSAGGHLWAFIDEGVVRTDLGGIIDVNGVNAPDGVLGPHREKEGSFYAIREIFSPVVAKMQELPDPFSGEIPIENRFDFANLNQCMFEWKLVNFNGPYDASPGFKIVGEKSFKGSDVKPGEMGTIELDLPPTWKEAEGLLLTAFDPFGKVICNWSWKIQPNEKIIEKFKEAGGNNEIEISESDSTLTVETNNVSLSFDKQNGLLKHVENKQSQKDLNLSNGPVFCGGESTFAGLKHHRDGDVYIVEVSYTGDMKYARWKIDKNGWIELQYEYTLNGMYPFSGISFDYPEDFMLSVKWLGNGPYRVWKNRMQGGSLNVWENAYNNTMTGYAPWTYPEFKGYFSDITWIEFNTVEGKFLVACRDENVFVRLFEFYSLPGMEPHPDLPAGDISFLDNIPPTGSKMSTRINARPQTMGPAGESNKVDLSYKRSLYFYFGALPTL